MGLVMTIGKKMVMAGKIIHKSGKRKKSIARTTIRQGSGVLRINSLLLDDFSSKIARYKIRDVLNMASELVDLNTVDISSHVNGGGVMGQADAIS